MAAQPPTAGSLAVLKLTVQTSAAQRDLSAIGTMLERVAGLVGPEGTTSQQTVVEALIRGLTRGQEIAPHDGFRADGLERLVRSQSPEISQLAMRLAGLLHLTKSPFMNEAWSRSVRLALNQELPLATRQVALALLADAPWTHLQRLGELLTAQNPSELQIPAIQILQASQQPEVAEILLARWNGLLPQVQEVMVNALFARTDRLEQLLRGLEDGVVPVASIAALRREQLLNHPVPSIRERAARALKSVVADDREGVVAEYRPALSLERDPQRGAAVFERVCAKCHRLGNRGFEVGPDLSGARTRADETLLLDILAPSSQLTQGYVVLSGGFATIQADAFIIFPKRCWPSSESWETVSTGSRVFSAVEPGPSDSVPPCTVPPPVRDGLCFPTTVACLLDETIVQLPTATSTDFGWTSCAATAVAGTPYSSPTIKLFSHVERQNRDENNIQAMAV